MRPRPVLHGDVIAAARALRAQPAARRGALCRRMLEEAGAAAAHVAATGRLHPRWGNGTLMAAARRRAMAPEPNFDDPEWCACFVTVLRALMQGGSCAGADEV